MMKKVQRMEESRRALQIFFIRKGKRMGGM